MGLYVITDICNLSSEEEVEVLSDQLGFIFDLRPSEAGNAVASHAQTAVALAIVAESTAGTVTAPSVKLDDLALYLPEAVDPVAPPFHLEPGIELRSRKAIAVEE